MIATRNSQSRSRNPFTRRLRLETLEDRRVLATLVVTDLGDDTLANLAGDGQLSLREAVEAVNTGAPVDGIEPVAGSFGVADTILFSGALFLAMPKTIALTAGQLELSSGMTIAGPTNNLLTIDGQQNSRIFDIAASNDDFVFTQLTLTGGLEAGLGEQGGAIRSFATGQMSVRDSYLIGNATTGNFAPGGAVWTQGSVVLIDSEISGNRTEGTGSAGGAVFAFGDMAVTRSTIADNQTMGPFSSGGGVSANGSVTLESSTVANNHVLSFGSAAGGVLAVEGFEMTESTVSGNTTIDDTANGAGISSEGVVDIVRSTVVNNRSTGANSVGGGVRTTDNTINVTGSIIANNSAATLNDLDAGTGTINVEFSLIGDTTGLSIAAATNILDQDPMLGPLAGGGQTMTHSPLPGSPVIDAGDPAIAMPPANDQRGAPFVRIADGVAGNGTRIDMGSHEVQGFQLSNFVLDSRINGEDFLAWQRGFGSVSPARSEGDADLDGDVDAHDLAVWSEQYGFVFGRLSAAEDGETLAALLGIDLSDSETDDVELATSLAFSASGASARDQAFAQSASELAATNSDTNASVTKSASQSSRAAVSLEDELVGVSL